MNFTSNELAKLLANNPDVTLLTDGGYTTLEATQAAQQLTQANIHDEYTLQEAVMAECEKHALLDDRWGDIYANVNGQYRPGQRMEPGLKKGVPDLFLPVPSGMYHGLYIELKWQENKPKREQIEWLRRLRRRGYKCVVIWDEVKEVIKAIEEYLEDA